MEINFVDTNIPTLCINLSYLSNGLAQNKFIVIIIIIIHKFNKIDDLLSILLPLNDKGCHKIPNF